MRILERLWTVLFVPSLCVAVIHTHALAQENLSGLSALKTVAETSDFQATSLEADVQSFLKTLDQNSTKAKLDRIGETNEGRPLHVLIVGKEGKLDLPLYKQDERLVVFLLGNIHSGECDGKEALLALARDSLKSLPKSWEERLVLVFLPNFNADANERVGALHRPGQDGPVRGMGLRENAQNLDLNRDFIKLETPEVRSLVRAMDHWNAAVLIDAHTTNGSLHRYPLTFDIPHNPATPNNVTQWLRSHFIPQVQGRMKAQGIDTFYYGNFSRDYSRWESYGYEPRYSTEYMGLRGRIGILSESYSYATYQQRVDVSYQFIRNCIDLLAEHHSEIRKIFHDNEKNWMASLGEVALRAELSDQTEMATVLGYAYPATAEPAENDPTRTANPRRFPSPADRNRLDQLKKQDYNIPLVNRYRSTLSARPPEAYLIPTQLAWAAERLRLHGIELQKVESDASLRELDLRQFQITKLTTESFQGLSLTRLEVEPSQVAPALHGSYFLVSTRQPLGLLATYLLEPKSDESLATWKFMDGFLEVGKPYPVLRVESAKEFPAGTKVDAPIKGERLTLEGLFQPGKMLAWGQGTLPIVRWMKDTEEYLQEKSGGWYQVDASTGAMRPFDRVRKLSESLAKLPPFADPGLRRSLARLEAFGDDFSSALISHGKDLYLYQSNQDETKALTTTPDKEEELAQLSPSNGHVAYVSNNNLYLVDTKSGEIHQVTHDGSDEKLNGILDWVYQEEIYGRGNFRAFWFSPDGSKVAFLQLIEKPVDRYQVNDSISVQQTLEETRYPKSGAPMPEARLFVVDVGTRKIVEMNLNQYPVDDRLLCRVHWHPNSKEVLLQMTNRIQTELRLLRMDASSGEGRELLHEKSSAWVDITDEPRWLPNGDFLWVSDLPEGRRRLYRYSSRGSERVRLTEGDWDIDRVLLVEADGKTAWVTGNIGSRVELHLVRVDVEKGIFQQVSQEKGSHRIAIHPSGKFYADTFSSVHTPPAVSVHGSNGKKLRTIVTPIIDRLSTIDLPSPDLFTIPASDGFELQSFLWKPSQVDLLHPNKRYPVLIHVYGGPRNPTVRNQWPYDANPWHPYLAQNGIFVFQCDNRSSRGRGNEDTWKIYKDLGKVELSDLEDAVEWLKKQPWVDTERIGIWGWSYGGYFTSFAMTHTKHFRAGIAGAPVTDWRNYDSIYTERYMSTPQKNEYGYKSSSVVEAANQLHGRLMILHGERDDNVHISNSLQLAYALQKAGKQFDLMVYPKNRHAIIDPDQKSHMYRLMTDFLMEHLVR